MDDLPGNSKDKIFDRIKYLIRDYNIGPKLPFGRRGGYYLCTKKRGEKVVMMKIMTKSKVREQKDKLYNEIKFYQKLPSSFFPIFKGIDTSDPKFLSYLFEYYSGGTLLSLLQAKKVFSLEEAQFYVANIIEMFSFLHSHNLIYRDLQPGNILIKQDGYLSLIDITYMKELKPNEVTYTLCGVPNYLAPEVILCQGYNKSVDWWTLGILIYIMLVGKDPFHAKDPMLVYQNIISGKLHFPSIIDKDAKILIKHLLNSDPKRRYGCLKNGCGDLRDHRFFNDFKWKLFSQFKLEPPFVPKEGSESNFDYYFPKDSEKEEKKKEEEEEEEENPDDDEETRRIKKAFTKNKKKKAVEQQETEALDLDSEAQAYEPEKDPFKDW